MNLFPPSKRPNVRRVLLGLFLLFLLGGCGQSQVVGVDARDLDPFSPEAFCAWHIGDPEAGRAIFERPVLADAGGCVTCHSLEEDVTLVGPSLYGVATLAETRQPGIIPANYLYLSITQPDFHVVAGFRPNLMPANYANDLTEEEITNLVSFLMTLEIENQ